MVEFKEQLCWVKRFKLEMIDHNRHLLTFLYWGLLDRYKRSPQGVGFVFGDNMKMFCYFGNWHNGFVKGLGMKFIIGASGESAHFGFYAGLSGNQLERNGP